MTTIAEFLPIFPALSETFILNEIVMLKRRGINIKIFSVKKGNGNIYHKKAEALLGDTYYFEENRKNVFEELLLHIRFLLGSPFRYTKTLLFAIKNKSEGSLWFFRKSIAHAFAVKSKGVEHIHIHYANNAEYGMLISMLNNIPFTIATHANDIYYQPPNNFNIIAQKSDGITVNSLYNQKILVRDFGIPEEKIEIIHSGIDTSIFCSKDKDKKENIILCVARLHPIKGIPYLIDACNILKKIGYEYKCIIIGDGPEKAKLQYQIDTLGLTDKVELVGGKAHHEVVQYYQRATLFVLPSISDASPITAKEALACGLPVIATNVRAVPEIVENGKSGFLVPPKDHDKLAECIEILLNNAALCRSFGKQGRLNVVENFNIENQINQLICFLESRNKHCTRKLSYR